MRTPKFHVPDQVPTWQLPVSLLMGGILALVGRYALQRTGVLERIANLRLQTAFSNLRQTIHRPKYQPKPSAANEQLQQSNKLHGDTGTNQVANIAGKSSAGKAKTGNGAAKGGASKRKSKAGA